MADTGTINRYGRQNPFDQRENEVDNSYGAQPPQYNQPSAGRNDYGGEHLLPIIRRDWDLAVLTLAQQETTTKWPP